MKVLSGHYSPETAYVVEDYPYGFRLRCKIRYWLEVNKKGTRMWSQTTNPKKPVEVWNTPKSSTYSLLGALFLDEENHVQWSGLSLYEGDKAGEFLQKFGDGLTPEQKSQCENLVSLYAGRQGKE